MVAKPPKNGSGMVRTHWTRIPRGRGVGIVPPGKGRPDSDLLQLGIMSVEMYRR